MNETTIKLKLEIKDLKLEIKDLKLEIKELKLELKSQILQIPQIPQIPQIQQIQQIPLIDYVKNNYNDALNVDSFYYSIRAKITEQDFIQNHSKNITELCNVILLRLLNDLQNRPFHKNKGFVMKNKDDEWVLSTYDEIEQLLIKYVKMLQQSVSIFYSKLTKHDEYNIRSNSCHLYKNICIEPDELIVRLMSEPNYKTICKNIISNLHISLD